jgi:hypothetical protein
MYWVMRVQGSEDARVQVKIKNVIRQSLDPHNHWIFFASYQEDNI